MFSINPALLEYINRIVTTNFHPVTFSGDVPNVLNRWLVKSQLAEEFAFEHLEPYLEENSGRILHLRELATLEAEYLERNWRLYISTDQSKFYQSCSPQELFAKDQDKLIYALCNVFCRQAKRVVIYANSITPIRIWINGELVLANNFHFHIKPYLFIFDFNKGLNTILVEKTLFQKDLALGISPDHFMMIIKPIHFLLDQDVNGLFDPEILEDLSQSLTVIPERAFVPAGQEIRFIVLPKILPDKEPAGIKVRISGCDGETITSLNVKAGEAASVIINSDISGVLRLEATRPGQPEKYGDVYLCYGDIEKKRDYLIAEARKRKDCNEALIDILVALSEIADMDTGCIRNFPQTVQDRLYYPVFKAFLEFESYLQTPDGSAPKTHFEVFRDQAFFVKNSEIDDGYILYSIHLPVDYDRNKRHPLLISMQYGYGMSVYPLTQRYVQKRHFREAIVLNICGRGHVNRDFINETELFQLFSQVIQNFNIDRDRVYIIGSCTGVYKAFGMALRRPDLFAAAAGVNGAIRLDPDNPDYKFIHNLNNTMIYQLCNLEDELFNGARSLDTISRLSRVKVCDFVNYTHDDFDEFLNQGKLMRELLLEKRVKYPRRVEFTMYEPIYNRSFWVRVDFIHILTEKADINAEIKTPGFIEVRTTNIDSFSLLLDCDAMGLEHEIEIDVNGRKLIMQLTKFSKVTVSIKPDDYTVQITALSVESFMLEYDEIRIPEELMGLKAIYLHKCRIVRPEYFKLSPRAFTRKLFYVLQSPLKERVRNYKYELFWESELNPQVFSGGNLIYVVDTRQDAPFQGEIMERFGLRAEAACLYYGGQVYDAEYFGLLKYPNPWNPDFQMLIVIYNHDSVEDELLRFLNSMDTNGLFYSDAVIYHRGEYHSFRKS